MEDNLQNATEQNKKVGCALLLGILFLPYIFSWFTLRKGYSTISKVAAFSWLGFALLIGIGGNKNNPQFAETEAREQKAEKDREAIAEQLSNKFDMSPECLFHFNALGDKSKTLLIKNCAPTKARPKPEQILSPDDRVKLKNLGFEQIKVDSWESAFRSVTAVYKFNDNATLEFVKYE